MEELRSLVGGVLLRNPNPEIAAALGKEDEVREARNRAERDFEWAKRAGIAVEGVNAEDFLRPPTKQLRPQATGFEQAARGQMSSGMKGWEHWAAKRNQSVPGGVWSPSRPLAPGEWVKVTIGTYAGDEGMVYDENEFSADSPRETKYSIFLVPRLPPAHMDGVQFNAKKRKRTRERCPARPFNPAEYETLEDKERRNALGGGADVFVKYKGMVFSHGLLIRCYSSDRLVPLNYVLQPVRGLYHHPFKNAGRLLIEVFQNHPFCQKFPLPLPVFWQFEVGEEVFVADKEELTPNYWPIAKGVVQDHVDGCLLVNFGELEGSNGAEDLRLVSERQLRKVVTPGDYIRVLSGPFSGKEGSVVEKHGPLLAILEKNVTSGKCFLVNRNSVRREKAPHYRPQTVPWLKKEVTVEIGRYGGRHGIMKDPQLSPYGDCFLLSLFLPELESSAKVEDMNVFLKGTRIHLWDFYPPEDKAWQIDPLVRGRRSGATPWKGIRVAAIGGQRKGYTGVVRDVSRTTKPAALSGLEVDVEFDVVLAGSGPRCEQIFFDHVREIRTGKTLNHFRPLSEEQAFYKPNTEFKGDRKRLRQHNLPIVTLPYRTGLSRAVAGPSRSNDLPEEEHRRSDPNSSPGPVSDPPPVSPDPLSTSPPDIRPFEASCGVTPEPELSWGPMNVWNPGYEDYWQILSLPSAPTPRSASPAPPSPTVLQPLSPPPDNTPSHWVYHEKLANIPIDVEITSGPRCTKNKKYGVYVKPMLGTGLVRDQRKASYHDIPVELVARPQRQPNKDALAVVIPRNNPHVSKHFGKLVHLVECFFDGPQVAVYRCWICAVVHGMDQTSSLTGEILVLPITDVEAVKQSKEVSTWAKSTLMAPVPDYMSLRDVSGNTLGERSYEDLTTFIMGLKD